MRAVNARRQCAPSMGAVSARRQCAPSMRVFSLARELTRVAIPSTEKEWLGAARGRTVREVEHLVGGHRPGKPP
jgi:hypothetical protein